ncbi:MAG: hypothetical protein ACRD0C_00730 [Acidimicrobiia bacterium]
MAFHPGPPWNTAESSGQGRRTMSNGLATIALVLVAVGVYRAWRIRTPR